MSKAISTGIIGLGRSGWSIHTQLLKDLQEKYRIIAVSDLIDERLEEAREEFGCKTYRDYHDLLKDEEVELVVVATPTYLHKPFTISALKAGKNVVCEKPMGKNYAEVEKMFAVAEKSNNVFTVFQNMRYYKDFLKVKEIIDSGKLGRIVQIRIVSHSFGRRWDWQTLKEFGGGTLNNNGVHLLDQGLQFMDCKEPDIFCRLDQTLTQGNADDHVKAVMKAPGEPLIDVELTAASAYPADSWLVMGTLGSLRGTRQELRWKYIDPESLEPRNVRRRPTANRSYNSEEVPWQQEETWSAEEDSGPGEKGFYLDLYRTIREGAPLAVTPESVKRLMKVMDRCHRMGPV